MKELETLLEKLYSSIETIIQSAFLSKHFKAQILPGVKWTQTFTYSPEGIKDESASGNETIIEDWDYLTNPLHKKIMETSLCSELQNKLINEHNLSNDEARQLTYRYTYILIQKLIESRGTTIEKEEFIQQMISDVNKKPIIYKIIDAPLFGITLESENIVLAENIILRKPKETDKEKVVHKNVATSFEQTPTAYLSITSISEQQNGGQLQIRLHKFVTLLKLYTCASVEYTDYKISSDSFRAYCGKIGRGCNHFSIIETYYIEQKEESALKKFIQYFEERISLDMTGYGTRPYSGWLVAFERFEESLTQSPNYQRRIAQTIMGLEALFVNSKSEVSNRLATNVGKFIQEYGGDGLAVKKIINDGYTIRSGFVHGDTLKDNPKNLEIAQKTCRYLSLGILLLLTNEIDYKILPHLIEDSLISPKENNNLNKIIDLIKNFEISI